VVKVEVAFDTYSEEMSTGEAIGPAYRAIAHEGDTELPEIVLLCTGNRARSPLAAALLARHARGYTVRIRSCGIQDVGSAGALSEMVRAARSLGVDLGSHRSSALVHGDLADASLVIGFEPLHTALAILDGGAPREVVFTLPELVSLLDDPTGPSLPLRAHIDELVALADARRRGSDPWRAKSIDDPVGRRQRTFDRVAREIETAIDRLGKALFVGFKDDRIQDSA
jgi:protein-tyrosine phosphatase